MSMLASSLPKDNNYTFKVFTLLIDYGGIVYRRSLIKKAEQAVGTLQKYLTDNESIIRKMIEKSIINNNQYNKIFPNRQAVETADTFDITLLACLYRNTCSCSPVSEIMTCSCKKNEGMWTGKKQILVIDTSETADLVRIRNFRNEILHIFNTAVYNEPMFESKWIEIVEVVVRRCPDLEPEINVLKSAPFDKNLQGQLEDLKQKLMEWKMHDIQVEEIASKLVVHDARIKVLEDAYVKETKLDIQLHDQRTKVSEASKANEYGTCIEISEEFKSMFQQDLISYYKSTCSKLQISPLIDGQGQKAYLNKFYISPTLYLVGLAGKKKTSFKSYSDVFVKKSRICQHIYISSEAGCGKSSLAKHMALCWCQAHQPEKADNKCFSSGDIKGIKPFKFLFLLYLCDSHECERSIDIIDSHECECSIDIMILNQLCINLANKHKYKGLEFLRQFLSKEKCLIVLDGLDEWSHPQNSACKKKNKQIPHSSAWPHCTILTTTRPWKLDVATLEAEEIDKEFKLDGLDKDSLKQLIERVIKTLNKLYKKNKKAKDFIAELEAMKLTHLSKIPVVAMQLLTHWYDGEPIGKSQCEIYRNMVEFLLKLFHKKNVVVVEGSQQQVPVFFQNSQQCLDHLDLLSGLGKLAFYTLFGDNRESSLAFDKTIVEKHISNGDVEISLKVGILTKELKQISLTKESASKFKFIHKTFQEFLAAFYITRSAENLTDVREIIVNVCCSIEKILEMSQIFIFMSGLCPEVLSEINGHLRKKLAADHRAVEYRSSLNLDPWSRESKIFRKVQDTSWECLQESMLNGHENVVLLGSDFFIHYDKYVYPVWSNQLKRMIVSNPVSSLSVCGVTNEEHLKDIANTVNEINSIQKLHLKFVPGTFVVSLFCLQKNNFNLKENWRNLEYITLDDVNISKDNLITFVDCITQLPKTVSVYLMIFDISPKNFDWRDYIKRHPHLTVVNDKVGVSFNTNLASVDVDHH